MRLRPLVLSVCLALTSASGFAGADPGNLPLGTSGWATPNVHPLAHEQSLGGGVGGAFLGKSTYVLSVADEIWNETNVPVTTTGGLAVYDVSKPESPALQAFLPLPNYQNEDIQVSQRRKFAVMSQDFPQSRVTLVDLSNPAVPLPLSVTQLPVGTGHTSTLVGHDNYLWVSGGDGVVVVDIHDLAAPKVLGSFSTPAGAPGASTAGVHDASVDQYGDITVYGSGGTAVHRLTDDPLHPQLVARILPEDNTQARDGLIHHGGVRIDRTTWLITEEDYGDKCTDDGSLEVWRLDEKAHVLRYVSAWDAPTDADGRGPVSQGYCSSHWFTVNRNHIVADGWYDAGVRFLDLSDVKHPRPIGMYAGDSTTASQAVFFPGRDDLVYVADYVRGLDVVKLDKGGRRARTTRPGDEVRIGSATPGLQLPVRLDPDPRWGWMCAVPHTVRAHLTR